MKQPVEKARRLLATLLLNDDVRSAVGKARFAYYGRLRGRLQTMDARDAFGVTVKHNLKSVQDHAGVRMKALLAPLAGIETLDRGARALVIGPRTESDLFLLVGQGFSLSNLRGLDLISYSPLVDLGDMHAMPYADDEFGLVVCGWTLSYSAEPQKAAREMLRVCRPGGAIAIAVEYSAVSPGRPVGGMSYAVTPAGFERINSVAQVLELFRGHVSNVFFAHDAPARRSHTEEALVAHPSSVIAIFEVKK